MKLLNAKQICDVAAAKGFGVPALNNNGGSYDIGRAIIESCEELQSPLIIQCYEPNLEYCGYDFPETGINLVKIKGLVDGFRNPRPWLYDVKMTYSPIHIGDTLTTSPSSASFTVQNRYSFTDLSKLKLSWTLEQEGRPITTGKHPASLPPLSTGKVELPLPADALARADALRVDFTHPDGRHVVAHRFVLKDSPPTMANGPCPAGRVAASPIQPRDAPNCA